jgi:hypothetical protein
MRAGGPLTPRKHIEPYQVDRIRTILADNVGHPFDEEDRLVLDNGAAVLGPVTPQGLEESLKRFWPVRPVFTVAIPILWGNRVIAAVLCRNESIMTLTVLDSRRHWDLDAYDDLVALVRQVIAPHRLTDWGLSSFYFEEEEAWSGALAIENILAELGMAGPRMPLLMQFQDMLQLVREHDNVVRFARQRPLLLNRQELRALTIPTVEPALPAPSPRRGEDGAWYSPVVGHLSK